MLGLPKRQVSGNPSFFTTFTAKGRRATANSPRRSLPMTRNALGRGLGALIREPEPQVPAAPTPAPAVQPHATSSAGAAAAAPARETVHPGPLQIDIDLI